MATTIAGISIEEYLRTSYTPDCEYLDGVLKEKAFDLVPAASQAVGRPGRCRDQNPGCGQQGALA